MNSVISTAHLTKKFLSSEAIHDLNFEVPEASIFGYLGPNGAGKTTTIKTLMNIFVASSGLATVLGLDSRRRRPMRHCLSVPLSDYVGRRSDRSGRHICLRPCSRASGRHR